VSGVSRASRVRRRLVLLATAGGVVLVGAGAMITCSGPRNLPVAAPTPALPAPVPIIDLPQVIPTPPPAAVAAVRIQVPELNIDLQVIPGDGVNAPYYKAAEYPAPLKLPGQGGRSMIYAHAQPGMFGPLFNGKVGQHVDVTLADGRQLHYLIREYYAHWPVDDLRWFQPGDHEQVLLVTCTTYNPNDPRIVAVAERA
jgi:LPXTG-site transpeptidase (sortase) family protein